MKSNVSNERILILHNIRSAQNVGSLLRTADAAGVHTVYLVGITPTPIDRFGRVNTSVTKASLGAEETVAWKYTTEIFPLLEDLTSRGISCIALEQSPLSIKYTTVTAKEGGALIVGNEVDGIPEAILSRVTTIIEIPMQGKKESLNVAVAGGIALFQLFGQ